MVPRQEGDVFGPPPGDGFGPPPGGRVWSPARRGTCLVPRQGTGLVPRQGDGFGPPPGDPIGDPTGPGQGSPRDARQAFRAQRRLIAPCCALLRPVAPCCALLRLYLIAGDASAPSVRRLDARIAPCCALLRLIALFFCAPRRLTGREGTRWRLAAPLCAFFAPRRLTGRGSTRWRGPGRRRLGRRGGCISTACRRWQCTCANDRSRTVNANSMRRRRPAAARSAHRVFAAAAEGARE